MDVDAEHAPLHAGKRRAVPARGQADRKPCRGRSPGRERDARRGRPYPAEDIARVRAKVWWSNFSKKGLGLSLTVVNPLRLWYRPTPLMKRALVILTFVVARRLACAAGPGAGDAGTIADAGDGGIPSGPSPGVCYPTPDQTGNSKHVGAYCSPGGGQCNQYGGAYACSVDVDPQGNDACIIIGCSSNSDCAEMACCWGRASEPIHACLAIGCILNDGGSVCPPIPGSSPDGGDGG